MPPRQRSPTGGQANFYINNCGDLRSLQPFRATGAPSPSDRTTFFAELKSAVEKGPSKAGGQQSKSVASGEGCAASYEARRFGVRAAMRALRAHKPRLFGNKLGAKCYFGSEPDSAVNYLRNRRGCRQPPLGSAASSNLLPHFARLVLIFDALESRLIFEADLSAQGGTRTRFKAKKTLSRMRPYSQRLELPELVVPPRFTTFPSVPSRTAPEEDMERTCGRRTAAGRRGRQR